MFKLKLTFEEAMKKVKKGRGVASPNIGFVA